MMNSASIKKADVLIDAVNEMMADEINVARLDEIVASASQMSDAGQYVEACNLLGMVAALRGDSFEVERRFKAAIQRGGNDAWTLGNYATALNHLVGVIQKNKHCEQLSAEQGELERPSQLVGAASGHMNDIAERKYMDEAWITASDRDFRSLVESLPDNVARWDTKGRYVYINPTHERLLGIPAMEIVGQEIPDTHDYVKAAIAQVAASGQAVKLLRQPLVVNGETRIHEVSLVPERDAEGRIISVLGIGRDMTDVYRMQETIVASEHKFRSLADSSPGMMGMFYARPDGSICMPYVSPNIQELFGLQPQDVMVDASPLMARTHPDDAQRVGESIAESARNMTTWHEQYRILHPTRGERWMESHTHPQPHPDGGVIWYGYVYDITGRKHIEEQHKLKEFALDQSHEAAYLIAQDGLHFVYVNEAACRSLGYSRDELLSLTLPDIDPYLSAVESQAIEAALRAEGVATLESRHRRRDGSSFPVEVQTSMFEYQGRALIMALVRDITERKRAELALEESRTQLRGLIAQREGAREEERKNIAREVHDELGQILTGLKMKIAVIDLLFAADSEPLRAHVQDAMTLMESAIGVARNISSALRPVELEQGIVAALEWQAGRFRTFTGMQCNVHIGDAEMQPDDNASIAIFRIVQESLTNVARHACASNVAIRLEREADSYVLKISDDGKGFDTGMKRTNAFGLVGLRERALMLGGTLCINSSPGLGTEIVVHIPIVNSQQLRHSGAGRNDREK